MDTKLIEQRAYDLESSLHNLRRLKFSVADKSGLRNSEKHFLRIIAMLNNGKPIKPSEAAKKLDVTVAAITHRINSLEKEGYIVRTTSPTDRRVVFISLSEKGTETVSVLKENHRQSIYGLVEHLGDKDSANFIDLLGKISNYYKQMENAGALDGNILGSRASVCKGEGKCGHVETGTCSHMEKLLNDEAN